MHIERMPKELSDKTSIQDVVWGTLKEDAMKKVLAMFLAPGPIAKRPKPHGSLGMGE